MVEYRTSCFRKRGFSMFPITRTLVSSRCCPNTGAGNCWIMIKLKTSKLVACLKRATPSRCYYTRKARLRRKRFYSVEVESTTRASSIEIVSMTSGPSASRLVSGSAFTGTMRLDASSSAWITLLPSTGVSWLFTEDTKLRRWSIWATSGSTTLRNTSGSCLNLSTRAQGRHL